MKGLNMINTEVLKRYTNVGYNVLFTGRHGVGKTALIKEIFTEKFGEMNEGWMYFSASTLDPWVDFIGIPKNYTNDKGQEVFKIIPPEHFTGDEKIQGIFFDEINRADDKTLNAIMELIQFKSINGRKFKNLKCIWAAENPSEDNEYRVGELDPAQRDRFQIQLTIPYELNAEYFTDKYGAEIFSFASAWWKKGDNQKNVSPRKLDSILEGYTMGFDISDFTNKVNMQELKANLASTDAYAAFVTIANSGDADRIKAKFTLDTLRVHENVFSAKKNRNEIFDKIYPHLDGEIQDWICASFPYTYINDRKTVGSLNDEQTKFLNSGVAKVEMVSENAKTIFDTMIDISKVFSVDFIQNNSTMDADDIVKLFPFEFDIAEYRQKTTEIALHEYVKTLSETDKTAIREYLKVLICGVDKVNQDGNGDREDILNILTFLKEGVGNALGGAALVIAAIERYKICAQLEKKEPVGQELLDNFKYEG